jgi:hypothetical protein
MPSAAELRALLRDCLTLWRLDGRVDIEGDRVVVSLAAGRFIVTPAERDLRPVRWFLQTPEREVAGRPPRALPSIVALLSALRNHMGGAGGSALRVGSTLGA